MKRYKLLFFIFFLISCNQKREAMFLSHNTLNLNALANHLDIHYINIQDSTIFHTEPIENIIFISGPADTLSTKMLGYKFIQQNNKNLLWVILSTKPLSENCHSCGSVLGSVLFFKKEKKWFLLNFEYFSKAGTFGVVSPHRWYSANGQKPVFLLKSGFTNMGYSAGSYKFYTILGDTITKILEIKNAYESLKYPGFGQWSYSSSIEFQKSESPFKNLIIHKSGTFKDAKMDSIERIDSILKFKFYSGKYHLLR